MTIEYTSDDPTIMAMQAALAAIDGYLAGQTSDGDMAEAYNQLQAVLAEVDRLRAMLRAFEWVATVDLEEGGTTEGRPLWRPSPPTGETR